MGVEVMYYKGITQATGINPGIFLLNRSLLSSRLCHPSMQGNVRLSAVCLGQSMCPLQALSPGTLLAEMEDQKWGIQQLFAVRFFPAPLGWDVVKAGNWPRQQRLQTLGEKETLIFSMSGWFVHMNSKQQNVLPPLCSWDACPPFNKWMNQWHNKKFKRDYWKTTKRIEKGKAIVEILAEL